MYDPIHEQESSRVHSTATVAVSLSRAEQRGLREGAEDPSTSEAKKQPRIVLRRQKSQRGGKTVIVVSQLPTHLSGPEIERLAREVRRALATGGSVQEREIELQGDQAVRVRRYFENLGYEVAGP